MKYLFLTLLAASSLLNAADFLPLAPGNQWILRSATGARQELRVGLNLLSNNGEAYYRLNGYRVQPDWVRLDAKGDLLFLNMETELPETLTRFSQPGEPYRTPIATCPQWATVETKRTTWRNLPALKISYEGGCPDNAITDELYLENIGLVQRTVSTIAGPVTYNLAEARVGNFSYSDKAGAFFDVALPSAYIRQENGEARTRVTLRLSARQSDPIRLLYSSSQQYDFKLFDQAGKLVWQWSNGRVFLPSTTVDNVVERVWEQEIFIEGVQPGTYVLEGSLTNSGEARYASSMTVRID